MLKNVMVTIDGSELSEAALPYARSIVDSDGVITLLSVVDLPDITTYGLYPMPVGLDYYDKTMSYAEAGTKEYLTRVADQLRGEGLKVREVIAIGDAAEMIVSQAQENDVDAIVMSTHGRSGINQWLFGSVTQKVLSRIPCPVFVVPGRKKASKTDTQEAKATAEK
jgi:nucleotide-binding universal stress UspA family protein